MKRSFGCFRFASVPRSRRQMLRDCSAGFGGLALAALLPGWEAAAARTHFAPKAKRVIFLFMAGGVSHVDTFDPKPGLDKLDGKTSTGNRKYLGSPWKFSPCGESGISVSELFPQIARHVDDLAIVRSMKAEFPLHSRGNLFLHTGRNVPGAPSLGAWISYGLGSDRSDLPGYVVLNDSEIPAGGMENFASAFLPATHQATLLNASAIPLRNVKPSDAANVQRLKLDVIRGQDESFAASVGDDAIGSAIRNYEVAFSMQSRVPDVLDLSHETEQTHKLYGLDAAAATRTYGTQCLRARRLLEAGVPFVEISMFGTGNGGWDQHGNLRKGHAQNALTVDLPIAGLIQDLKDRGLWQDTVILFSGEMGRTLDTGNGDGRDHHVTGFSAWLAGGGIKGGIVHGATDEIGEHAVEKVCTIHDLHATILHLLGFDHEKLTYRFGGRDMRLTDVSGTVVKGILT